VVAKKPPSLRKYRVVQGEVTPEDLAYAQRQDRWGCAVVRAIQRALPEATFVRADKNTIRLSLEEDGYRYTFEMPPELRETVVKPFDLGQSVETYADKPIKFKLNVAIDATEIVHQTPEQKAQARSKNSPNRRSLNARPSVNVHTRNAGRYYAEEAAADERS
jgi:hypothetical protein